MRVIASEDVKRIMPRRSADANKYSVGSLLCVCGSRGFAGASVLSISAALRSGAGFVRCMLPKSIYPIVSTCVPEAVFSLLSENEQGRISSDSLGEILKAAERADTVLIGPGLGNDKDIEALVLALVSELTIPVILDADGINCISKHIDVIKNVKCPLVLTPHEGEFSRLVSLPSGDIHQNREAALKSFIEEFPAVLVLKGKDTLIGKLGEETFRNPTGNAGMATAGSGDVLAGMIGALLSQGVSPFDAAVAGVYLHGLSGDIAEDKFTQYSMLPSDMISCIPEAIKTVIK